MRYLRFALHLTLYCLLPLGLSAQTLYSAQYAKTFEDLLQRQDLIGTIVVLDASKQIYHSNNMARAAKGYLPASTFKIPNTLIALETGVVADAQTILPWDGEKRANVLWQKDLTLKEAFRLSCVPCYQEIAGQIGVSRMIDHLAKFRYPAMDVRTTNLQQFWLTGDSKISALEQIYFLQGFYNREIPLLDKTYQTMLQILEIESTPEYAFSGKTGWSTDRGDNGWFVGFLRRGEQVYYFATNVTPKNPEQTERFLHARELVTRQALRAMQLLNDTP